MFVGIIIYKFIIWIRAPRLENGQIKNEEIVTIFAKEFNILIIIIKILIY